MWTVGSAVEIKLRFHISPAWCRRRLRFITIKLITKKEKNLSHLFSQIRSDRSSELWFWEFSRACYLQLPVSWVRLPLGAQKIPFLIFRLDNASSLFTLYPSHQSIYQFYDSLHEHINNYRKYLLFPLGEAALFKKKTLTALQKPNAKSAICVVQ